MPAGVDFVPARRAWRGRDHGILRAWKKRRRLRGRPDGALAFVRQYQFIYNIQTALSLSEDHALQLSRLHLYQSRNSYVRGYFSYQ